HLDVLYRRFSKSAWAAQGHRLHAESLLQSRRIDEARAHYLALADFPGPLWPLVSREGLVACKKAMRLLYAALFAWAFLALGALFSLWRGRRHLWPPPFELYYYLPVAAFLTLAAFMVQRG